MAKTNQWINEFERIASALGVVGVVGVLLVALAMEFFFGEKPCPLCSLQRVAFVNIGIALLMNLRYQNRVAHWAFVILSSAVGAAVSIRQILLHVNDPIGFGSAIWGLHMYTWCFIIFSIAIAVSAMMLIIYPENH